jgi:hypothetical protein
MTQLKTLVLALAASTALAGAAAAAPLIVNGDFSAGNTGFHSDYTYSVGNLWGEGAYDIVTDPHNDHSLFSSFGDHTTGDGNMMGVNGSGLEHAVIWGEDAITLAAATDYTFSFWMASEYPTSPAVLMLNVNGAAVGGPFLATSTTGAWTNYTSTFHVASGGPVNLGLWNENLEPSGNDFALDDISLTGRAAAGVPEPASWALMLTGFFGAGALMRRNRAQLAMARI